MFYLQVACQCRREEGGGGGDGGRSTRTHEEQLGLPRKTAL